MHAHYGNIGLDSESPVFGAGEYADIKAAAALSQAAFDAACSAVLGDWYDSRSSGFKSTTKVIVAGL